MKNFHRDSPIEVEVLGFHHSAHAALAKQAHHAVLAAQKGARFELGGHDAGEPLQVGCQPLLREALRESASVISQRPNCVGQEKFNPRNIGQLGRRLLNERSNNWTRPMQRRAL